LSFQRNTLSSFFADVEDEAPKTAPSIRAVSKPQPTVEAVGEEEAVEPEQVTSTVLREASATVTNFSPISFSNHGGYNPVTYLSPDGSLMYLSQEEKQRLGIKPGIKKINVIAPEFLGKSNKTGMKYYRVIRFFYPPSYLAKGSDRSPDLTPEGIAALVSYSNCPEEERTAYLEQLKETYQAWLRAYGAIDSTDTGIEVFQNQSIQLEITDTAAKVFNLCKRLCEGIAEEALANARQFAKTLPARINKEINSQLTEELGEYDESN